MAELETILVVEDNDLVLGLVVSILKSANFKVLQADGGAHAIQLAKNHVGKIDLLLSGVQMPGITGPGLGDELKSRFSICPINLRALTSTTREKIPARKPRMQLTPCRVPATSGVRRNTDR